MDHVGLYINISQPYTINPMITQAFPRENCIEVVGDIKKEEPNVLIPKVESVEITADDIRSSSDEDESSENATKPDEGFQIHRNNSGEALLESDCKENQEPIASRGNINYVDKFYNMESNLDEDEMLVLNDPQAVHNEIVQSNQKEAVNTKVVKSGRKNRVKETDYKVTERGKFQCLHCEFGVTGIFRKHQMTQHILNEHREVKQLYQCPYCPYKSPWWVGSHVLSKHTSDKDINWFRCDKCDYKGKTQSQLNNHSIIHYNDGDLPEIELLEKHKCTICEKGFKNSGTLKRHIRQVHKKEKPKFCCDQCDFTTTTNTGLERHIEVIHTDAKHLKVRRCQKCNNYETKFIHRLKTHMSVHHSTPVICEICGHNTKSPATMKLHQITHQKKIDEKDLKYRCNKCDYKTYRIYSFNVHKLNHLKPNQIKYFYCYHCGFKAKRKDNLKTHVLRHFKKEEVTLGCYLCEFSTKKRQLLTDHLSMKHTNKKQ